MENNIINSDAEKFLELIKRSRNGKFKIYIGLAAGVGKSYRMLLEAHELIKKFFMQKNSFLVLQKRIYQQF